MTTQDKLDSRRSSPAFDTGPVRTTETEMTPERTKELHALCSELPLLEHRLRKAGLYSTAIALNVAVRRVGYEVENLLAKANREPGPK